MPYDERLVGWLSATETLEELFKWFTNEDIKNLKPHGFTIVEYETCEYKRHENHWVIKQDCSNVVRFVNLEEI